MTKRLHKKISKNINKIMNEKNITQKELASKLKIAQSTLNLKFKRLENGKTINLDSLFHISKALKVDPIELLK